jgi:hypothetical protein
LTTPATPSAFRTVSLRGGIRLKAPLNWTVGPGKGSLVATISSGTAIVAVWRYPRSAQPPAPASLSSARTTLIHEAKSQDPGLQMIRSSITTIDGHGAIELDAFEQVGGEQRRVRSTHVFETGAELVLDEYAPAELFHVVDHTVFSPLKRSLVLASATA